MKVKAKISFTGAASMYQGQVADMAEGAVLNDLLRAGYVEAEEVEKPKAEKLAKKGKEKAVGTDENKRG